MNKNIINNTIQNLYKFANDPTGTKWGILAQRVYDDINKDSDEALNLFRGQLGRRYNANKYWNDWSPEKREIAKGRYRENLNRVKYLIDRWGAKINDKDIHINPESGGIYMNPDLSSEAPKDIISILHRADDRGRTLLEH